jgi:hypothetical protein
MHAPPDVTSPATAPARGFWFRRRNIPWPTWRLWLCALLTVIGLLLMMGRYLHGWLSVTAPVPDARYLVVEGWVPDHVLSASMSLADDSLAQRVFTTGIPIERGSHLIGWKTYAEVAAQSLARLGLEPQRICPVPCADVKTERTRAMATALKAVLDKEPVPDTGRKINLVTLGTHARRSRAIFQDVLGPAWEVGIVSVPSLAYDPAIWYRQSDGAKTVINELSALTLMAAGGN